MKTGETKITKLTYRKTPVGIKIHKISDILVTIKAIRVNPRIVAYTTCADTSSAIKSSTIKVLKAAAK